LWKPDTTDAIGQFVNLVNGLGVTVENPQAFNGANTYHRLWVKAVLVYEVQGCALLQRKL
jgi:hypothetical protein